MQLSKICQSITKRPVQGPELPVDMSHHSLVQINSTVSLLIGGMTSSDLYSRKTYYFDHIKEQFLQGPELNIGRYYHASSIITDQITDEKYVVVSGGENNNEYPDYILDSTEILINNEWRFGMYGSREKKICFKNY